MNMILWDKIKELARQLTNHEQTLTNHTEQEATETTLGHVMKAETGSNENGKYIKYPDGRLEIRANGVVIDNRSGSSSGSYRLNGNWVFPVSFDNLDYEIIVTLNSFNLSGGSERVNHVRAKKTSTNYSLITMAMTDGQKNYQFDSGDSIEVSVVAYGRWKS